MSLRTALLITSTCIAALTAAPLSAQQPTEIENVAAFARLYGVARWFYPSDAAAELDWDRFAIEGVRRVRDARSPAELETRLTQLFTPLGPGIVIGTALPPKPIHAPRNPELIAWRYRGPGFTNIPSTAYVAKRINRSATSAAGPQPATAIISQTIRADTLRGRAIRMRALMRVVKPRASGWAGLWLRVDRASPNMGFFDNMQDRPVRDTTWREYVIEGTIASDATQIEFGAMSVGATQADVDAIEISVRSAVGMWKPLAIRDAGFENVVGLNLQGWSYNQPTQFARPTTGAPQGTRFARVATPTASPTASTQAVRTADSEGEVPTATDVSDVVLARGLLARVPLSLTDAEALAQTPGLAELRTALASAAPAPGSVDTDMRLADVVVAWNVFRHFYPYWGDLNIDWDARLRPLLDVALKTTATRVAHLDAMRMLVAELNDGHGQVTDPLAPRVPPILLLQFRVLSEGLVVTASRDSAVPVGSLVSRIGDTPASTRILTDMRRASGTPQWKRTRAEGLLQLCPVDSVVTFTIEPPTGPSRKATVPCKRTHARAVEARPDSITELEPGIWYVDLSRVFASQLSSMLPTLAKARGVVFDVRGYPTDAGHALLPHLMRTPELSADRWMHVPRFARPFGEVASWWNLSWYLRPAAPQITAHRVFLTDGRAISYAESVMGYVSDYKLGTIIGGTTAGANGNVAGYTVPSGFSVMFTGLRVTRHDGRTPFQTAGVAPDIPLEPTLGGIRAGRDELLARALTVLRPQP